MPIKTEKDINIKQLKKYLKDKKYSEIDLLSEYYELACLGLKGVVFQKNSDLIIQVLKVISNYNENDLFTSSILFAEKLFDAMEVNMENETEVYSYLGTLNSCLASKLIDLNSDNILELCMLFENKIFVKTILALVIDNPKIIDYVRKARQYYVDERAFISSILEVNDSLKIFPADVVIDSAIEKDRQNAGVYIPDNEMIAFFEIKNDLPDLIAKFEKLKVEIDVAEEKIIKADTELSEKISVLSKKIAKAEKDFDQELQKARNSANQIKSSLEQVIEKASETILEAKNVSYSLKKDLSSETTSDKSNDGKIRIIRTSKG